MSDSNKIIYTIREFKDRVIKIMKDKGVDKQFIYSEVTYDKVRDAILNGFSPESLAWSICQ